MSWQYVPSLFRLLEVPGFTPPDGIWRGTGRDEGDYAFYHGPWGGYLIVRRGRFAPSLLVDGYRLDPVFSDVNGYVYWSGGGRYVYFTRTYGWVYASRFPGYEPLESHAFDDEGRDVWTGDSFWSLSGIPSSPERTEKAKPRGSRAETGSELQVTAVWPRWVAKAGEFGIYEGKDGEEGERVKGLPRYRGGNEWFVRSLKKDRNGYFTYGRIRNLYGTWTIGEPGSPNGWHEGAEPNRGGAVTFRFMKNEGSDVKGSDIRVAFHDFIAGDETETAYLGSAAIWR